MNKMKLFLSGLQNRFSENTNIFKGLYVTFTAGLKEFNGVGSYKDNKISYNFNGKTELFDMEQLFDKIYNECEKYDAISIIYSERGSNILITGDNKSVKMTTTEAGEDESVLTKKPKIKALSQGNNMNSDTSTLLNRDYYIKVGKADSLLKEIGIMSTEGKIKNDKIRKYNQIDHYVELLEGVLDTLPSNQVINILDCGCGKSYLTFVLNYYLTEVKRKKCHFIGLDYSSQVIEASKEMAQNLAYRNMEFHAMDIKDYIPNKKIHVIISLHACDTATDMALALGVKVGADVIIAVPCCHRELLKQYSYSPFKSITKHGVFNTRLADILTDGMRSLLLEAKGYEVSVVEYISPLETPKNLMIKAIKTSEENESAMDEYTNLMSKLNVYPALYAFLNEWYVED